MTIQMSFRGLALIMLLCIALALITGLMLGSREWLNPAEARRKDAETAWLARRFDLELEKERQELERKRKEEEELFQLEMQRRRLLIYAEFAWHLLLITLLGLAGITGMAVAILTAARGRKALYDPWADPAYRWRRREEARARERITRAAALKQAIHHLNGNETAQRAKIGAG